MSNKTILEKVLEPAPEKINFFTKMKRRYQLFRLELRQAKFYLKVFGNSRANISGEDIKNNVLYRYPTLKKIDNSEPEKSIQFQDTIKSGYETDVPIKDLDTVISQKKKSIWTAAELISFHDYVMHMQDKAIADYPEFFSGDESFSKEDYKFVLKFAVGYAILTHGPVSFEDVGIPIIVVFNEQKNVVEFQSPDDFVLTESTQPMTDVNTAVVYQPLIEKFKELRAMGEWKDRCNNEEMTL